MCVGLRNIQMVKWVTHGDVRSYNAGYEAESKVATITLQNRGDT